MHYHYQLILLFLTCLELHKIVFHPFVTLFLLMYIYKKLSFHTFVERVP